MRSMYFLGRYSVRVVIFSIDPYGLIVGVGFVDDIKSATIFCIDRIAVPILSSEPNGEGAR